MNTKKIAAAVLAAASFLCADQVKMNDGSVLNGTIKKIGDGKVVVSTSFAGDITISQANVQSMVTDAEVNVATATGKLSGKVENGKIGAAALNPQAVTHLWTKDAADPTLPPPPKGRQWQFEVEASLAGKTGNSEKFGTLGGAKASLVGDYDKLVLYSTYKYTKDNGVESEREFKAGFDFERQIQETMHSWYARSEYEYDKIDQLDPQVTSAAGYGWYAVKEKDMKIRLRAGVSHTYKHYSDGARDSESNMGMDFNYHHEIALKSLKFLEVPADFLTDITYTPAFESLDNYRIYHESSLSFPLASSKNINLRLGVSNDYQSQVAEGKKHMDTTYFAKIVLSWK